MVLSFGTKICALRGKNPTKKSKHINADRLDINTPTEEMIAESKKIFNILT
ncbi:hypothetical protein HAL07_03570 [Helicobacter ailurogastricus]|uniref:Uncharacterized protein n=1 Tax=Helicobacter ailurogastricus TaxID=1578720 RepID=A0A0K2XYQ2_9HELI|nr:hypothetical protein HAL07_03570 [Helicobacter ailurogastricus]